MTKTTKPPTKAAIATPTTNAATPSKIDIMIALLRRTEGATIEQLVAATGWQKHSVRGAMSGTLKKKQGLTVTSGKADGVRIYRITGAAAASAGALASAKVAAKIEAAA